VRGAKAPGFVFAGLATALSALLLAALSPSQPPPPPIAEYAPEAVQAIKDAPDEQSAEHGLALGDVGDRDARDPEEEESEELAGGGIPTTTTSTTLPPNSERVRLCVGKPSRQTEDPQSPPCVPYFEGDNGGATARGVTQNEIKIGFPSRNHPKHFDQMLSYFNRRFELYGRQVRPVGGGCFGGTPQDAQNLARGMDTAEAFASSQYCDILGTEAYYYEELARRGIVGVNGRPTTSTEADLAKFHPYWWTFVPTWDKGTRHLAELACSLRGQPARYAGPAYRSTTRKFGLLQNSFSDAPPPDYTAVKAALQACGIEYVAHTVQVARVSEGGQGVTAETAAQVQNAVFDFQSKGVTSILVLTHTTTTKQLYAVNDAQGYQPELLTSTYLYNDEDAMSSYPAGQLAHTFGVTVRNMGMVQVEDEFHWQAVNDSQPGQPWEYAPFTYTGARFDYGPMLMLFAGLQMAGPHLTADSFAAGLLRAKWTNPPHRNMPGRVTIGPGTHSFMEDAAIIWWSPAYSSEDYGQQGGFCFFDGGRRWRLGQYPKADPGLFQGRCGRGLD